MLDRDSAPRKRPSPSHSGTTLLAAQEFISGISASSPSAFGIGATQTKKSRKIEDMDWSDLIADAQVRPIHSLGLQATCASYGRVRLLGFMLRSTSLTFRSVEQINHSIHFTLNPTCTVFFAFRFQYVNGRKRDFAFHGGRWHDCKETRLKEIRFECFFQYVRTASLGCIKECRWLETECKKLCFDRPAAIG